MKDNIIMIPALNPPESLVGYIQNLIQQGFKKIVVIDDGSNEEAKKIFDKITKFKECIVLRHVINLGKGRALKKDKRIARKI